MHIFIFSRGHLRSRKKIGPDGYSRFDVSCLQTNTQTKVLMQGKLNAVAYQFSLGGLCKQE